MTVICVVDSELLAASPPCTEAQLPLPVHDALPPVGVWLPELLTVMLVFDALAVGDAADGGDVAPPAEAGPLGARDVDSLDLEAALFAGGCDETATGGGVVVGTGAAVVVVI